MKKNTILSLVCFLMAFVVFALAVPITSFAKESASMYASVGDFVGQKVYTIRNVELDNYMQADDMEKTM